MQGVRPGSQQKKVAVQTRATSKRIKNFQCVLRRTLFGRGAKHTELKFPLPPPGEGGQGDGGY
jgi:hypothetical protein